MGAHCVAKNCSNTRENSDYSFFSLPKDKKLAQTWKIKVKRDERALPKNNNFFVCEVHFEKRFIERDFKGELLGIPSKKKKLIPGAYPTIFDHVQKVKTRSKSEARSSVSNRRNVV